MTATAAEPPPTVPSIEVVEMEGDATLNIEALAPAGYGNVLLEALRSPESRSWTPLVSGALTGSAAKITFRYPEAGEFGLVRMVLGTGAQVPRAPFSGSPYAVVENIASGGLTERQEITHVLNRIAYGPSPTSFETVRSLGVSGYINQQLTGAIDESDNARLTTRVSDLFLDYIPGTEDFIVEQGTTFRYMKGTEEPPAEWKNENFDASGWLSGASGIGYGDDDDATTLDDMGGDDGYLSVYMRTEFEIEDPSTLENFALVMTYDDGFVAYINGEEVARANLSGTPPRYNRTASSTGGNVDGDAESRFFLEATEVLKPGTNVLAVQVHNATRTSSDLTALPELATIAAPPYESIAGISELQELAHIRGVYSENQLRVVLSEFWENHFTTDSEKVYDYLRDLDEYEDLEDRVGGARVREQTYRETARMEWEEYEFFHQNALGNFGDLLLYSATSPSMLVYLDNVLNRKDEPNENYAREILELYAFGVDNRYTQADIEQLSRCFTGWTVKKTRADTKQAYPDSARTPPTGPSLTVESESVLLDLGPGWKYFKGRSEPTPDGDGNPTADWTTEGFSPTGWSDGSTGIGYNDGDDETELNDMRNSYSSVYLRREFQISEPEGFDEMVMETYYDDGYVAYLNGEEIGRSPTMDDLASPPRFDDLSDGHEATGDPHVISLEDYRDLLLPAPQTNVLAIQVHNTSLSSSDLSMRPRILARRYTADSIEVVDAGGLWTFRFDPEEHDTEAKTLFEGTAHEVTLPAGREGIAGVRDALEVIDAMVSHPSTAEFIVSKLINRFVSDEISIDSYHEGTAPPELIALMNDGIASWQSTQPAGNVATVMRTLLDPETKTSAFWSDIAFGAKVKNPIEYINSALRAVDSDIANSNLPDRNEDMGMDIFQREDPDGFPESGFDWMDTQSLLERMRFAQGLTEGNAFSASDWDVGDFMGSYDLATPEELIDLLDESLFAGELPAERKTVLLDFVNSNDLGAASQYSRLSSSAKETRLSQMVALLLSLPEFQFQ